MKKRRHYKPITPRIPMLVVMHQVQYLKGELLITEIGNGPYSIVGRPA